MKTINIKYVDTTRYNIEVTSDYDMDSPTSWGNYEIVQFCGRDKYGYASLDDYCTENGKLLPSVQAKIRAGKIFTFTYNSYSNTDGGYYRYPSNETNPEDIDGFIIFDDAYIKNTTYEERKRYATGDLEEYTLWANGEVYSVIITDASGNDIANCSGFIGDDAVKQFIADELPDAMNENVTITGVYDDGTKYDVYFDYNDCVRE